MTCKNVQYKVVSGDPLDAAETAHVATCAACQGVRDTVGQVTQALGRPRREDPHLVARVTAAAEARLRRPSWPAALVGVAVVAAGITAFVALRQPKRTTTAPGALPSPGLVDLDAVRETADRDVELRLILLSDTETSRRLSARWSLIESPLHGLDLLAGSARAPLVAVEKDP